ncbi:uncharacterized protein TM35_000122090 [Trypanosoma theileri]|uniref:Transmembrane protein n=1 Tax=Trypanosoma theileri TaxID=67003 RepID=A0A1X0NXM0_9TRYP|nr:uncharacterized protein TM35_000122090 [Trypanosoma theileri]ORC89434.1 hypothetical protein TM35_000122090 [Trypanosoma theileri]
MAQVIGWVRRKVNNLSMTKQEIGTATVLVVLLYVSSAMMFFGMNFWLWSFEKGLKRSYTSILIPSLGWALLFFLSGFVHRLVQRYHGRPENFFFWVCHEGVMLLFLIGLFDSLTGLFGMYAAVHVPVLLQSALISTGPIWTYLLASFLYPESQPSFSPLLLVVIACTAGGVALAMIPQAKNHNKNTYFSPPWIVIFLCATALFPLYNVLQGRFLHKFSECCSPFTAKIVMLTVETIVQLFLTIMYFPLDSLPFFGKCDSIQESWDMLLSSVRCIGTCPNNAGYMLVYVLGFWIRHLVFAYMNSYSPIVAAVTSQLTQPINTFLLLLIPSWNVYGAAASWYYTMGCFFLLLVSTIVFVSWHLFNQQRRDAQWGSTSETTVETLMVDETNEK